MIDFSQQHLAFGGKGCITVRRGMNLRLSVVACLAYLRGFKCAGHRSMKQGNEIALGVLNDIIDGTSFQRHDGDLAVFGGGNENNRRRRHRQLVDLLERRKAVEAWHMLIERDHVDAALFQTRDSAWAVGCMIDFNAMARKANSDQTGEARVVVDIEQSRVRRRHALTGGTCITEKNRPSCRMALAKLS